jgi:hypothetical protein
MKPRPSSLLHQARSRSNGPPTETCPCCPRPPACPPLPPNPPGAPSTGTTSARRASCRSGRWAPAGSGAAPSTSPSGRSTSACAYATGAPLATQQHRRPPAFPPSRLLSSSSSPQPGALLTAPHCRLTSMTHPSLHLAQSSPNPSLTMASVILPVNTTVGRSGVVLVTLKSQRSIPPIRCGAAAPRRGPPPRARAGPSGAWGAPAPAARP